MELRRREGERGVSGATNIQDGINTISSAT